MRKWVWRLCVALWLLISAPFVLGFLLIDFGPMLSTHPLSYFERRDPTTCPGYYDRYDDELLACIHNARMAQFNWIFAKHDAEQALRGFYSIGPWLLAPFWIPLAIWALVRLLRRARNQ